MSRPLGLDHLTIGELRQILAWTGSENITLAEALAAMAASTESTAAHEAAWAAHLAACDEWIAGRGQAARDARATLQGGKRGQMSTGAEFSAAQEAATDAARDYEHRVPRPTFSGKPTLLLEYGEEPLATDRVGRVAAAVDRVKELVS